MEEYSSSGAATVKTWPIVNAHPSRGKWRIQARPLVPRNRKQSWQDVPIYRATVNMHDPGDVFVSLFDFSGGPVEIRITSLEVNYIYRCDIRPKSLKIRPRVSPRSVHFVLSHPVELSIEINRDRRHNICLFAGGMPSKNGEGNKTDSPKKQADIEINGDALHDNTLNLPETVRSWKHVRRLGESDHVTVFVHRAHYDIADCVSSLPSNLTVDFEAGTTVAGAFRLEHVQNVVLSGHAIVELGNFTRYSGLSGITIDCCRNIAVSGLCFIDPPHYTILLGSSSHILLDDVKSFSCEGWSDGIDMMSCSSVAIRNCFLRTSDDCIAIYASRFKWHGDTRDITVSNCTLWADVAHPMNIGTHGNQDEHRRDDIISNIRFSNIDVLEQNEYQPDYLGVMAIDAGDGNTVENITWKNIRIEACQRVRVLDIEVKKNRKYNLRPGAAVRNVLIENVDYDAKNSRDEEPSLISGFDRCHRVESVTLRQLKRNGVACTTAENANLHVRPFVDKVTIE